MRHTDAGWSSRCDVLLVALNGPLDSIIANFATQEVNFGRFLLGRSLSNLVDDCSPFVGLEVLQALPLVLELPGTTRG